MTPCSKIKHDERQRARAQLILDHDFEQFVAPKDDPVFARPVPTELLREMFGRKTGYMAFCGKTRRRWLKFIKKQRIPDSDKILLSNNLFEALGE